MKKIINILIFRYLNKKIEAFKGYLQYQKEYKIFKRANDHRFCIKRKDKYPCLNDKNTNYSFDRHYVYHTAWAARTLSKLKPLKHVDISSDIRFTTLVSAFIPIEFYDYHSVQIELTGLTINTTDITNLHFKNNSIESLSCMHVVEHIGLGRYGDSIDPQGDLKAINELTRVLAVKGNLLFVVPIGKKAKIMFNAHRIYTHEQILNIFHSNGLSLQEFTLIPESLIDGNLVISPSIELLKKQNYACGCYWFSKEKV